MVVGHAGSLKRARWASARTADIRTLVAPRAVIAARRFLPPDYVRGRVDDAESGRSTLPERRVTTVQRIAQQCQFMAFVGRRQTSFHLHQDAFPRSGRGCAKRAGRCHPQITFADNVLNLRKLRKIWRQTLRPLIRPADSNQSGEGACSS